MIFTLFQIGLAAGLWAGNRWVWGDDAKSPAKPRPENFGDLSIPRTIEGAAVPTYWGRVRVRSPILVDAFGFESRPRMDGFSFTYSVSMAFVVGMPPAKSEQVRLHSWWAGDQPLFFPEVIVAPMDTFMGDIEAFGGGGAGGGLFGSFGFYSHPDQVITEPQFLAEFERAYGTSVGPAYRGMTLITMSGLGSGDGFTGYNGFLIGESVRVPGFHFEVGSRPYADDAAAPAYYKVDGLDGDMNPAGVIHDILTDGRKLGFPESALDLASFTAAALVLAAEGHGISLCILERTTASEVVEEVLAEIDGTLYIAPTTGQWTLKLIRDDYDVEDLPLFDPSNILAGEAPEVEYTQPDETFNELRVIFTDRQNAYAEGMRFAQDQAGIEARGTVRSTEVRYPGVTSAATASRLASRDLRVVATPLRRISFMTNRDGASITPGSCVRVSWPDYVDFENVVVRITKVDPGRRSDGRVTLSGYEDVFGIADDERIFDPSDVGINPDTPAIVWPVPPPVLDVRIVEAPRYLQRRAKAEGRIADVDGQHLLYLSAMREPATSVRGTVRKAITGIGIAPPQVDDHGSLPFGTSGTIASAYARTVEFDTSTGFVLEGLTGPAPTSADEIVIALHGDNLALLTSDAGDELIAFETVTDNGDGTYTIIDVWRGLLDTPMIDHPAGARLYLLKTEGWEMDTLRIGRTEFEEGDIVFAREVPRNADRNLDASEVDHVRIEIQHRTTLPLPPTEFRIYGTFDYQHEIEGEIQATWTRRNANALALARGDYQDAPASGEGVELIGRKGDGPEVSLGIFDDVVGTFVLGSVGHGVVKIGAAGVRLSDGVRSWDRPEIEVLAPVYRDLLSNGNFMSGSTASWEVAAGSIVAVLGPDSSASNTYFVKAGSAIDPTQFSQTVDISGFGAGLGLDTRVEFDAINTGGDVDDTVAVLVSMIDDDNVTLDTFTVSATPSATEYRNYSGSKAIAAGTTKLRVRVALGAPGANTTPLAAVGNIRLVVGIFTGTLTNMGFESGTTGWTVASGSWRSLTSSPREGAGYLGGGSSTVNLLRRDFVIDDGFEGNATAVVEFYYKREITTTDRLTVIVEARDVGGVVLGSETSDVLTGDWVVDQSYWRRATITLAIPYGSTTLRVSFEARKMGVDADSTNANVLVDKVDVRFHKTLEPSYRDELDFSAPATQFMPSTIARWWQDVGELCPAPDLQFFNGSTMRSLLSASTYAGDTAVTSTPDFVGGFDGTGCVTSAMEFASTPLVAQTDVAMNVGDLFAWAGFFRIDPTRWVDGVSSCGIFGRIDATRGYGAEVLASGAVRVHLLGKLGAITLTSSNPVQRGGLHYLAVHHDGETLTMILDGSTMSTSSTGVGRVASDPAPRTRYRVGQMLEGGPVFIGQIARVYAWGRYASLLPTVAELASLWTHHSDPSGRLAGGDGTDNHALMPVLAADGTLRLQRVAPGSVTIAAQGSTWGLATGSPVTRIEPDSASDWTLGGTGGTRTAGALDAEGFAGGVALDGGLSSYLEGALTPSATPGLRATLWLKGSTSGSAAFELRNASGVLVGSQVLANVGTSWTRVDVAFTWDNSTPGAAFLRIYPTKGIVSRTITLSATCVHQSGAFWPTLIPATGIGVDALDLTVWYLDESFASAAARGIGIDGELHATGIAAHAPESAQTIVTLYGSGDQGRRTIRADASGDLLFDLGNDAGTVVTSEVAPSDAQWQETWGVRARWSRAGLYATGAFAGLYFLDADDDYLLHDNDVASAFTLEVASPVTTLTIGPFTGLVSTLVISSREEEGWVPVPA